MIRVKKLSLMACFMLAITLTFNCSNGNDESGDGLPTSANGSTIVTDTYNRVDVQAFLSSNDYSGATEEVWDILNNHIFLSEEYREEHCQENGTLKSETGAYVRAVHYSINNNALSFKMSHGYGAASSNYVVDDLDFHYGCEIILNGSSNTIEGTWTRTKDKVISCYEDNDITKVVFTQTTATITREICVMDELDSETPRGWTSKVIDCNNGEVSKGKDKVRFSINTNGSSDDDNWIISYTYNNKTCTFSDREPSTAQKQQACAQAASQAGGINWMLEYYYLDNLEPYNSYDKFAKCLEDNNFPPEFLIDRDSGSDSEHPSEAKMLKKSLKQSRLFD